MTATTWDLLVQISRCERPHSQDQWHSHRALYRRWQALPLREQASEIRAFLEEPGWQEMDWLCLIPAGECAGSQQLFLSDLRSLFRVLAAPAPKLSPRTSLVACLS